MSRVIVMTPKVITETRKLEGEPRPLRRTVTQMMPRKPIARDAFRLARTA